MKITLISKETYDELLSINNDFPCLFLQNSGYEGINRRKFTEAEKQADKRVNDILKKHIHDFSKFQNFRLNKKSGELEIRLQYHYDVTFTGVGYILVSELLNGFKTI